VDAVPLTAYDPADHILQRFVGGSHNALCAQMLPHLAQNKDRLGGQPDAALHLALPFFLGGIVAEAVACQLKNDLLLSAAGRF